jgi:Dolichyl-phosphate-mannose-protein mannosyltransferase
MLKRKRELDNIYFALLLACLTALILTCTAPSIGLTWDEPAYIAGAEAKGSWFYLLMKDSARAVDPASIDQFWSVTHEHPGLDMAWSGMVWIIGRHIFDDLTAHRLGNIILVAFLVALLYLMVSDAYGRPAGLFAAAALMSMPRFFFHSHLAALDVPVTVAIFGVTFLFWRTVERREWWWGLVLAFAWGMAMAVKLNAVFIPIALVIWFIIFRRKWYLALRLFLMGLFAIPVFIMVWPWLYNNTWERIIEYIDFHFHHHELGQWYLGQFYLPPPWHFVLVMIWAVVPSTIMVMVITGIVRARSGRQDGGLGWLLIISSLVSIAPFLYGKNLVYDNERLFMAIFPFLAALSGSGFGWVFSGLRKGAEHINRPGMAAPAGIVLGLALLAPQALIMSQLYPHLLSYYSEGVGGLPGATKLGLETTYWCETYSAAIPYINEHAQPGDRIWTEPWSHDVLFYYQLRGKLRSDLHILSPGPEIPSVLSDQVPSMVGGDYTEADWIIFQYRQTQYGLAGTDFNVLQFVQTLKPPVFEVSYQGIPLMQLFHR